jgi:hypothetical protein
MNTPKNAQFIVLTPQAYDSGWSKQECHTPDEAFAIGADLYERGQTEVKVVDIAKGTLLVRPYFIEPNLGQGQTTSA